MSPAPRLFAVLLLGLAATLRAADRPMPNTVIDSDTLDSRQLNATETLSVFTGHVVVTGNDIRMTCNRLEMTTTRLADKADASVGKPAQFKHLLATGDVHIIQGDREAACGRAEVMPSDNRITLTENPKVTDRGNNTVATGDKLVLLRGERRVTGTHVRIIGPPVKDLGFNPASAPPAPNVPADHAAP